MILWRVGNGKVNLLVKINGLESTVRMEELWNCKLSIFNS